MYKRAILICILLIIQTATCKLENTILKEDLLSNSLTKCVLNILRVYANEKESILTSMEYESDRFTDRNLLKAISKELKWSLLKIRPTTTIQDKNFKNQTINNYLIQIRGVREIKSDIQYLQYYSWNPQANFIIFANKIFYQDEHILIHTFHKLWAQRALNSIVLLPQYENSTIFDIHSWFPYANGNCGTYNQSTHIDVCEDGIFQKGNNLFPEKIPLDLNNCPVKVRTIIWPPYVIAPKKYNRSQIGINFTQGLEIQLLNTIAEAANFKVVYTLSKKIEDWGFILDDGNASGIFKSILAEEVDIGVSSLAATLNRFMFFDPTIPYTTESLTWCIATAELKPLWLNVYIMFNLSVWILGYLTFVILALFLWMFCKILNESTAYSNFGNCFINTNAVISGQSLLIRPFKISTRTIFFMCAFFNLVMAAVYQTSLVSFLTDPIYEKEINKVEEMFNGKYTFLYIPVFKLYFNMDPTDWRTQKILKIMEECPDTFECVRYISDKKNYTMPVPRLYLEFVSNNFINKDGHLTIHWFKDDMVSFPVQMYMVRGFPLQRRINGLIVRILQSGLQDKWIKDLKYVIKEKYENSTDNLGDNQAPEILHLSQLQGAFYVLLLGLGSAVLIFLGEIILHKIKY